MTVGPVMHDRRVARVFIGIAVGDDQQPFALRVQAFEHVLDQRAPAQRQQALVRTTDTHARAAGEHHP